MPYQALYRKYRPVNFDDVVGQDTVIKILKNALIQDKTSHAYMFSGPRGVGKTSIAKIFAKAVNCLNNHDGNPCGECSNCKSILLNETTDIIEIDAASNNGVDEIREIRNNVNLVPSELKYKVYIIDEVHMLSIGAFNALLKTLEEPPNHVIFILATTDPHKVPVTIVSRCQCFEFKRISNHSIVNKLKEISSVEKINIDDDVLEKIAEVSEGGMRDSLGLLDKISSYCDGNITIHDFNKIVGVVSTDLQLDFIKTVYEKNIAHILELIDQIYDSGKDFIIFSQNLMEQLRKNMIEYYLESKNNYPIDFILEFIQMLDELIINLKNSSNMKILFETFILSFASKDDQNKISFENEKDNDNKIISREIILDKKENKEITEKEKIQQEIKLDNKSLVKNSDNSISNGEQRKKNDMHRFLIVNNTFATAEKKYLLLLKEKWTKLNDFVLDISYGAAACFLVDSQLRAAGDKDIIITCNYDSALDRGFALLDVMEELLEKVIGSSYKIAVLTEQEWKQEKEKFIQRKNRGEKYEYKEDDLEFVHADDEKEKNSESITDTIGTNSDDIIQQAVSLFGNDIVKIQNN